MKRKLNILQIAVSMIVYNFTVIAFSWCFKLITDSLTIKEFNQFYHNIWISVVVVMAQVISNYLFIKGKNLYVKNAVIKLKSNLIKAIFNYDIPRFQRKDITEYQSFLFNDLSIYEQNIVSGKIDIMEKLILLVFSGIAIAIIRPSFLFLIVLSLVFSIVLPSLFAKYAKRYNSILSEIYAKTTDKIIEILNGFTVIRTFSIERKGVMECTEKIEEMENAKNNLKSVMAIIQSSLMFMTTILTLIIFVWGGRAVVNDLITVGGVITLIQLVFNIANPLMGIMNAVSNMKSAQPIRDKYNELMTMEKKNLEGNYVLKKGIHLQNLSFSYQKDSKPILDQINYTFEKNKKYAIVGGNGSGKSTLLKLLAGVIDYNGYKGTIMLDELERKKVDEKSFWKHVSYIPQQVFLFKKGIKENIFLNGVEGDNSDFLLLSEKLNIATLFMEERCSSVMLGEGNNLSGGERQKVAFIREILKDSSLILADEPDAALDPDSSFLVQEILLKVKKTCIVVTHRINSNLEGYDEIIVMEDGEIIETGSYSELMRRKGILFQMSMSNV